MSGPQPSFAIPPQCGPNAADAIRFRAALVALQTRLSGTIAAAWLMPGTDATVTVYIANVLAGAPVPVLPRARSAP